MNIIISGKNMDITDALREQTNKKVGKLERYFEPGTEAHVTLSVEKNRHIVEVTIPFNGIILRAEESTDDMYASIDKVLDKRKAASLKVGGQGIRYTCRVSGKEIYMFLEDGSRWFIEGK